MFAITSEAYTNNSQIHFASELKHNLLNLQIPNDLLIHSLKKIINILKMVNKYFYIYE